MPWLGKFWCFGWVVAHGRWSLTNFIAHWGSTVYEKGTGTVHTFPSTEQFECNNTLENRRFGTKIACFYRLFLSIAELFLFLWWISTKWTFRTSFSRMYPHYVVYVMTSVQGLLQLKCLGETRGLHLTLPWQMILEPWKLTTTCADTFYLRAAHETMESGNTTLRKELLTIFTAWFNLLNKACKGAGSWWI